MMKILFVFSVFCLLSSWNHAQHLSQKLDSITREKLALVSGDQQAIFRKLFESRDSSSLNLRLDTIKATYAILEESYSTKLQKAERKEKYFFPEDSIQYLVVKNGISFNSSFFGAHTSPFYPNSLSQFDGLFQQAFYFKPEQLEIIIQGMKNQVFNSAETFNYIYFEPYGYLNEEELKKVNAELNEEFKYIYKIYTLIDLKDKTYWVSLQVPKKNPDIQVYNNILLSPYGW